MEPKRSDYVKTTKGKPTTIDTMAVTLKDVEDILDEEKHREELDTLIK